MRDPPTLEGGMLPQVIHFNLLQNYRSDSALFIYFAFDILMSLYFRPKRAYMGKMCRASKNR